MPRKKPLILVVVGNGSAPASVIHTGICDAFDMGNVAEIAIAWYSEKSANLTVYEWLDSGEDKVYIYANGIVPKSIAAMAEDVAQTEHLHADILSDSFERAQELDADLRVLLLWDEDNEKEMEEIVLRTDAAGFKVLDLSNGLVPITVEDDDTPDTPLPVHIPAHLLERSRHESRDQGDEEGERGTDPLLEAEAAWVPYYSDDDDEVEQPKPVIDETVPFTSQELTNMPLAALKRMVIAQGKELPTKPTKAALIEVLLETDTVEPAAVVEVEQAPILNFNPTTTYTMSYQAVQTTPSMVIIYKDGSAVTFVLNDRLQKVAQQLLAEAIG